MRAVLGRTRRFGEMAEWFKAAVLKTVGSETGPGVRIPLSPPTFAKRSFRSRLRLAGRVMRSRCGNSLLTPNLLFQIDLCRRCDFTEVVTGPRPPKLARMMHERAKAGYLILDLRASSLSCSDLTERLKIG